MEQHRKPTPDEIEQARQKGLTVDENSVVFTGPDGKRHLGSIAASDAKAGELAEEPNDNTGREIQSNTEGPKYDINKVPVLGMAKRQTIRNLMPAAAGVAVGGLTTPLGPWVSVPAGLATAALVKGGQEKLINKYTTANPNTESSRIFNLGNKDVEEHPYGSLLAAMPSAVMGGGSFMPHKIPLTREALTKAGKIAGVMAGADIGMQGYQNITTGRPYDIKQTGFAALAAPFWSGKNEFARNAPPNKVQTTQVAPKSPVADTLAGAKATYDSVMGKGAADEISRKMSPIDNTEANARAVQMAKAEQPSNEQNVPRAVVKPAEASAKALNEAEMKSMKDRQSILDAQDALEKEIITITGRAEKLPQGHPDRDVALKAAAELRNRVGELQSQYLRLVPQSQEMPPVGVGLSEIARPTEGLTTPITKKQLPQEPQATARPMPDSPVAHQKQIGYTPPESPVIPPAARVSSGGQGTAAEPVPVPEMEPPVTMPAVKAQPETQTLTGKSLSEIREWQQMRKKGGQSGSIANPFQAFEEIVQSWKNRVKSESPETGSKDPVMQLVRLVKSPMQRLASSGEIGKHIAESFPEMANTYRRLAYTWHRGIDQASKGISNSDAEAIGAYLRARWEGQKLPTLTPAQQSALLGSDDMMKIITLERSLPESPWVKEYDKLGNATERPFEILPNWHPMFETTSRQSDEIIRNQSKYPEQYKALVKDFVDYYKAKHRMTDKQALDNFNARFNVPVTAVRDPRPQFASLRYAAGLGVPPNRAETNPFRALTRYAERTARDLGYHRVYESDPVYGKSMGLESNGRGQKIPDKVTLPSGVEVTQGNLGSDPAIAAMLRDYVNFQMPGQNRETWTHAVTSALAGTVSQVKDIGYSPIAGLEVLGYGEYARALPKALEAMVTGAGRERAFHAGSAKPTRQISPSTAIDLDSAIGRIADFYNKYTGAELTSQSARVFNDALARSTLRERLAAGDWSMVKQFGPKNLSKYSYEQLEDYIASEFTMHVTGSYDAQFLPEFLTRGSANWLRPFFSLMRYPMERFNRWVESAYKPALKGDIGPLLKSAIAVPITAAAMDWLREELFKLKPRHLKISEWLGLGGLEGKENKETLYSIFSRLDSAAYAGILSQLAFMGVQVANKEVPFGVKSPAMSSVEQMGTRLGHYIAAVANGDTDPISGLLETSWAIIKDRSQMIRVLAKHGQEDTGNREEAIAKRMGYMPNSTWRGGQTLPDIFSTQQAYRSGNVNRIARIMANKAATGQSIPPPEKEWEGRVTGVLHNGEPVNYYEFIKRAQGEKAMEAAQKRDIENTRKKYETLSSAISR